MTRVYPGDLITVQDDNFVMVYSLLDYDKKNRQRIINYVDDVTSPCLVVSVVKHWLGAAYEPYVYVVNTRVVGWSRLNETMNLNIMSLGDLHD
jgi:hypothetical protein